MRFPKLIAAIMTLLASMAQAQNWSAAWQAPQGDAFLSVSANQATLRQILTSHAAGSQVRLRLSNLHGKQPVSVGAVSLGASGGGALISGGAPVPVLFSGQASVVLAPGESRYSDPVRLSVHSMQRLAVSFYIPGHAVSMSRHFTGNEWVWSAPGDATGQASAQGFTQNKNLLQTSSVLIDRLDVDAGGPSRRVVAMFGDSITDGFMGTDSGIPLLGGSEPIGQDVRFPDFLQRRADAEGVNATFVSAAISGNRMLAGPFLPMFGPSGLTRLTRDVSTLPGVTDAFVLLGINDLGLSLLPTLTGQQLKAGLRDVIARLHQSGIRVTVGTLLPSKGASFGLAHGSPAVNRARQALNQWVLEGSEADAVVDFEPCMKDLSRADHLRAAYDSGDGLHPNAAGYRAMAECVNLAVFR